jgi:hypothetical protein
MLNNARFWTFKAILDIRGTVHFPIKSDDNRFIEQKTATVVQKYAGCNRLVVGFEEQDLLAAVIRRWFHSAL